MAFHIAIDAVGAKHSGAATVLLDLLDAALQHPAVARISVFSSPAGARQFSFPSASSLQVIERPLMESSVLARLAWLWGGVGTAAREAGADVLVCLGGGGLAPKSFPTVQFLQQSLPFSPEALSVCTRGTRVRMRAVRATMAVASRQARLVVVQTQTMAQLVCHSFGIPKDRAVVIMPGPRRLSAGPASASWGRIRLVPSGRRILYVGNDMPYKGLSNLLKALQEVRRSLPDATLFVASPGCGLSADGVVNLGYLPPTSLRELYELADVLVLPSLTETVGLPLLEAMRYGTAVCVSDRPYAHDVCGAAADFFDPRSPRSIADSVAKLLNCATRRDHLVRRGRRRAEEIAASNPSSRLVDAVLSVALTDRRRS